MIKIQSKIIIALIITNKNDKNMKITITRIMVK